MGMKHRERTDHNHTDIRTQIITITDDITTDVNNHIADYTDPHEVTKTQVGLSNVENIKVKLDAAAAPTVNDDSGNGYAVGSRWIDVTNDKEYTCLDSTVGAAVWTEVTGGTDYLRKDGSIPLTAVWTTGNFNIKGLSTICVSATAPTSPYTNMLWQDTTVSTRFLLKRWDGSAWKNVYGSETVSRTINVNNGMSTAGIQTEIDGIGKNILAGVIITLQFADGTYTLTDQLEVTGFYGGGILYIYGNNTNNSLSTTKAVHLDFSGQACLGLYAHDNMLANMEIFYLKISFNTTTSHMVAVKAYGRGGLTYIRYCYVLGTSTSYGYGIYFGANKGYIKDTYINNMKYGLNAANSSIVNSFNNDDTGTMPIYGLTCASSIMFKGSTQPAGSTANELKLSGGQIF